MAKITLKDGSVFEGTIEEFKQLGFKLPMEEAVDTGTKTNWAKIGRKPNKFKKGDIVRVEDPCGAPLEQGELVTVKSDSRGAYSVLVTESGWAVSVSELITPVEERLDR